jgi:hypothetical protein
MCALASKHVRSQIGSAELNRGNQICRNQGGTRIQADWPSSATGTALSGPTMSDPMRRQRRPRRRLRRSSCHLRPPIDNPRRGIGVRAFSSRVASLRRWSHSLPSVRRLDPTRRLTLRVRLPPPQAVLVPQRVLLQRPLRKLSRRHPLRRHRVRPVLPGRPMVRSSCLMRWAGSCRMPRTTSSECRVIRCSSRTLTTY